MGIYQQIKGQIRPVSLGRVSTDLLKRIENIESEIQSISAQLPFMLPSDHVTDNGSVTEPGWALDARQNNSSLDGSLANLIKRLETKAEYILRALSPNGYGSYDKTIKQVLEELIKKENFSETRTRRWFINAKKRRPCSVVYMHGYHGRKRSRIKFQRNAYCELERGFLCVLSLSQRRAMEIS